MMTNTMSKTHTEIELKLAITDPQRVADLLTDSWLLSLADAADWQLEQMTAVYFDTADHRLQAQRMSCRIRRENNTQVATVKGGGTSGHGLHTRQEWNVPATATVPTAAMFAGTPAAALLTEYIGDAPLLPICATDFERHTLRVEPAPGTIVEVAVDRGEIIAGDKREPLLELELEVKQGESAEVLRLGAALLEDYPLRLETRSKYYRALVLAGLAAAPVTPTAASREAVAADLREHIFSLLQGCQQLEQQFSEDVRTKQTLLLALWAECLG